MAAAAAKPTIDTTQMTSWMSCIKGHESEGDWDARDVARVCPRWRKDEVIWRVRDGEKTATASDAAMRLDNPE